MVDIKCLRSALWGLGQEEGLDVYSCVQMEKELVSFVQHPGGFCLKPGFQKHEGTFLEEVFADAFCL